MAKPELIARQYSETPGRCPDDALTPSSLLPRSRLEIAMPILDTTALRHVDAVLNYLSAGSQHPGSHSDRPP